MTSGSPLPVRDENAGPEYSYDPYGDAGVEVIAEAVQVLDGRG
jgi:hypothetical protein